MGLPEYLYHYTSIEALAQILKNKTIRFTKLSLLNDPTEGQSEDYKHSSKLVYSSSWTASSQDTIPLWKMYTDLKGIRIKMPVNMFETGEYYLKSFLDDKIYVISKLNTPITINLKPLTKKIVIEHLYGPEVVNYSSDVIYPAINKTVISLTDLRQIPTITPYQIGLNKPEHWSFEEELRFRLFKNTISADSSGKYPEFYDDFIYIPIKSSAFCQMEILLAPKTEYSHKLIVESLCNTYLSGLKISIEKSKILIK